MSLLSDVLVIKDILNSLTQYQGFGESVPKFVLLELQAKEGAEQVHVLEETRLSGAFFNKVDERREIHLGKATQNKKVHLNKFF